MQPELQTALHAVSGFSYLGIFGVSLIANIFVPVPEEIFLLALGYLIAEGFFHPVLIVLIVIVGFMISDTALYLFARRGNKFVIRMRDKFMKRLSLTDDNFIERHMNKVIFFSRFLVQFRFLGPVLAGSYKTPYKQFFNINMLALLVYVPLLVLLGDYFHDRIERVFAGIGVARNIIFAVLGIIVAIIVFKIMQKLFMKYMGGTQKKVKEILGISKIENKTPADVVNGEE